MVEVRTDSGWDRRVVPATIETVKSALERFTGGDVGTLQLKEAHQELWISGGPENFSVWGVVGPDDFFDLIGDPGATGTCSLVIGGQEVDHPARHCVSAEQALQAARSFIASKRIPVSGDQWERQGASSSQ